MTALLDGVDAPPEKQEVLCKVGRLLRESDDEDKKILARALESQDLNHGVLAQRLSRRGFSVSESVVRRHRVETCACARSAE